jgi:hypothetical protein
MRQSCRMERMRIQVLKVGQGKAIVRAVSARKVGRQPEAIIFMRLTVPPEASARDVRDVALRYLDPE